MASACGPQEPTAVEEPTGEVVTLAAPTTLAVDDPAPTTIDPGLPAAPWSGPPLPSEAAPSILKEQWDVAGNKGFCAALYPTDANDLAADAVVRSADFGTDAWAVAWDRPEGPGRDEQGAYCEDCGRGAFGVAGITGLAPGEVDTIWPDRVEWSDGSVAGYGIEGLAAPDSGAPHLAYLAVEGQGCTYNAWSFLGEDHLLQLLDELRFVEGMLAAVVNDEPTTVAEALGPAPWSRTPLGDAAAPPPLLAEWNEEVLFPETCPLLTPVSLGQGAQSGVARRAENAGEMLAAWDLPSGPGRYGSGDYCADCGRGALGIGTIARSPDAPANFESFAVTHTWDDGSELRIISEATELFRVSPQDAGFTDPVSEQPVTAPYNGYLLIPGLSCGYRLWSFLGVDHLVELTQNLRPVIGYGAELFTESACPEAESQMADVDGDDVIDRFRVVSGTDGVSTLILCRGDKPPVEYGLSGLVEVLTFGDLDGDGDAEILTRGTSAPAAFYEALSDEGEAGLIDPLFSQATGEVFTLIDGVTDDVGYRWGCRDDGTVVQVQGRLSRGSLAWTRTAYRIEGLAVVDVGAGSGSTPVVSADLADAIFEDAITKLVGRARCEE